MHTSDRAVSADVLADWVQDARARSLELIADLDDGQLFGPKLPTVNPMIWEIGHAAWFHEKWILRHVGGAKPIRADGDRLFDSIGIAHAARWDLPELVANAVEFHHEPDSAVSHALEARIVQAADMLAKAMSLGYSGDDRAGPLPEDTCEALHLKADGLEPLMEAVLVEFNQVSAYVLEVLRDERQDHPENRVKQAAKTADTSTVR